MCVYNGRLDVGQRHAAVACVHSALLFAAVTPATLPWAVRGVDFTMATTTTSAPTSLAAHMSSLKHIKSIRDPEERNTAIGKTAAELALPAAARSPAEQLRVIGILSKLAGSSPAASAMASAHDPILLAVLLCWLSRQQSGRTQCSSCCACSACTSARPAPAPVRYATRRSCWRGYPARMLTPCPRRSRPLHADGSAGRAAARQRRQADVVGERLLALRRDARELTSSPAVRRPRCCGRRCCGGSTGSMTPPASVGPGRRRLARSVHAQPPTALYTLLLHRLLTLLCAARSKRRAQTASRMKPDATTGTRRGQLRRSAREPGADAAGAAAIPGAAPAARRAVGALQLEERLPAAGPLGAALRAARSGARAAAAPARPPPRHARIARAAAPMLRARPARHAVAPHQCRRCRRGRGRHVQPTEHHHARQPGPATAPPLHLPGSRAQRRRRPKAKRQRGLARRRPTRAW